MKIELRLHQAEVLTGMKRWNVIVFHRRAGKTILCIVQLLIAALGTKREDARFHYIGPTFGAAKAIAWDILVGFCHHMPGVKFNVSELRVDFSNGARIQLLGVERVDTLRGRYSDGCVLDEAQLFPTSAWAMVIRPMLADRLGWAILTGTPAGHQNLLGQLYQEALRDDDWQAVLKTIDDTDALPPSEVAALKRQMSPQAFAQEFYCSFTSALTGAFYAAQLEQLDQQLRITKVDVDNRYPVYAALDLGFSDATSTWFFQKIGNNVAIVNHQEYEQMSLPDIHAEWEKLPYKLSTLILPHDAKVHDIGTGKTRLEVLRSLGYTCHIAKKTSIHDGIEAARNLLPRCWFDFEKCSYGLEALRAYRSNVDQVKRVSSTKPIHDWSSHAADGFRYLAVAIDQVGNEWDLFEQPKERARSW